MSPFRVTERSTKLRCLRKTTRRSRVHVQTVGLNAETTKVSAPSRRGDISLDIRFYRTSPTEKQRLQSRFQWVVDPGGIQDALGADGGPTSPERSIKNSCCGNNILGQRTCGWRIVISPATGSRSAPILRMPGISSCKRPPGPELSSACADDHKTCIFAQFGSCHENVTQIADNGGKSAANDNK